MDRERRPRLPEHLGRAALGMALAALVLAGFGLLAGRLLGLALLGQGALQVAFGGGIAGVTLAGIAGMASRGRAGVARPGVRRRAAVAAALSVALMLGLLALPSWRFGRVEVAPEVPPAIDGPSAAAVVEDADGTPFSIAVDAPPARAFEAALASAEALGWDARRVDREARRFEAVDPRGDPDVAPLAVRVEPAAGGAVVRLQPRGPRVGAPAEAPAPARVRAFSERLRATVTAGS